MGTYGLGQGLAQGIQLRSMIEDLHWRRQQRALQQQEMVQNLEDRKRKAAFEDFALHQTLNAMPAVRATPEEDTKEAGLESIAKGTFGPGHPENYLRGKVDAPFSTGKQSYYLPSRVDTQRRQDEEAGRKAGIAEKEKYAEAHGSEAGKLAAESEDLEKTGIPVTYPGYGDQPGFTMKVPRASTPGRPGYAEHIKNIRAIKAGKIIDHKYETDTQTGKTYLVGIDADTQEPIRREMPGQITPKPARGSEKEELPSNEQVEAYLTKWRKNAYSFAGITEEDQALKDGRIKYDPKNKNEEPADFLARKKHAEEKIEKVEKELWTRATEAAKADNRKKSISSRKSGQKLKPYAGKGIAEKDIPEAARYHGMSEEMYRTEFEAGGGTVTP